MRGREVRGVAERLFDALVGEDAARAFASEHRLESHAVEIGGVADMAARGQFTQRAVDRGAIVGHPLAAPAREQAHRPAVDGEQAVLERRGAEVGDEDAHGSLSGLQPATLPWARPMAILLRSVLIQAVGSSF